MHDDDGSMHRARGQNNLLTCSEGLGVTLLAILELHAMPGESTISGQDA